MSADNGVQSLFTAIEKDDIEQVIGFYEGHHKGKGHAEIIQILEQAGAINVHRPMIEI